MSTENSKINTKGHNNGLKSEIIGIDVGGANLKICTGDAVEIHYCPMWKDSPLTELLKPYAGRKVDLGIRPSDFEPAKEGVNAIKSHVDSIEPLGDAYLIYVRIGEKVVVFKYAGEKAPTENELLLTPNMAKLHLFDPETQKRINA